VLRHPHLCRLPGLFGPFPSTSLDELLVTIFGVNMHDITMENRCQFSLTTPIHYARILKATTAETRETFALVS
jgi:hypothetical protein